MMASNHDEVEDLISKTAEVYFKESLRELDESMGDSDRDLEMLKVDYNHTTIGSLLIGLEMCLEVYAKRNNWRPSTGHPPHNLREGVRLDLHPSNVVDGYHFAQEAIEKIEKWREENLTALSSGKELAAITHVTFNPVPETGMHLSQEQANGIKREITELRKQLEAALPSQDTERIVLDCRERAAKIEGMFEALQAQPCA